MEKRSRLMWIALAAVLATTPFELHLILRVVPSHFSDLYSPWMGVQALWHGANPYSREFTEKIFRVFYGRQMHDHEFETQAFVYPAHTALLFAPLALMSWKTTRLFTTAILPPLVALTAWVWAELFGLARQYRWSAICLVTCSWPAIWAYQQTQPTVIVIAAVAACCLLLARKHDIAAAMCLTIATAKPNLSAIVISWLLLQAMIQRRWRFVIGFVVSLSSVLACSLLAFPHWFHHWLAAASLYGRNPSKPPDLTLLLGTGLGRSAIVFLALWLVFWVADTGVAVPGTRQFNHGIALLMAYTTCIIPTTAWMIYNEVALIPAIFLIFTVRGRVSLNNVLARLCLVELLLIVPLCVLSMWMLGFKLALCFAPFLNLALPLAITLGVAGRAKKPIPAGTTEATSSRTILAHSGNLA